MPEKRRANEILNLPSFLGQTDQIFTTCPIKLMNIYCQINGWKFWHRAGTYIEGIEYNDVILNPLVVMESNILSFSVENTSREVIREKLRNRMKVSQCQQHRMYKVPLLMNVEKIAVFAPGGYTEELMQPTEQQNNAEKEQIEAFLHRELQNVAGENDYSGENYDGENEGDELKTITYV
ncbi:hypothetical protein GQX74_013731 [Glossina fuscipes]|nr:hypothetical protein GQX74_013731 [Glossina fuscipes]